MTTAQDSEAADTIDALRAEKDRLTACLEKANASAEHFEREWYLRGDELDTLRAQLAEAQRRIKELETPTTSITGCPIRAFRVDAPVGRGR